MYFCTFPWSIMFLLFRENQFIRVLYWEIEMLLLEWIYQAVFAMIVYFSPIFESCSHSQNISILHYKKGQSNRNNFTYQKKKEKTEITLWAIILSFLSEVAYFFPVKIITCKMLQEIMKILFGQPSICHLKWIIFTSGRQRLKTSQLSRIFSSPMVSALRRWLTLVQQWQPLLWLACVLTCLVALSLKPFGL